MKPFMAIYRRMQLATNTQTQSELAKILAVRQSSISDAKRRDTIPAGWYITLFEKFGLSQDWLRYGTGPMYLRTEQGYMPQEGPIDGVKEEPAHYSNPTANSKIVTVYSMTCQPNGANRIPALEAVGKLALPSSFAVQNTLVFQMQHNDMAPTVCRGAYLGVDTTDTQPASGGVFVLKNDYMGLLVRRIYLDCGSSTCCYCLRSDNAQCPESAMPPEEFAARTVGRVNWVMQKIA